MAKSLGLNMPFVYGETESEERNRMRLELHAKNQKCVISNAVWRRGINIPSLGVVINAAGEKSETQTIQRIGRGFRKAEGKDEIIIVDFLDRGKYLADHCVNRMSVYAEEGWL
jgi:superfamily II DNA or RNA helicase